MSEKDSRLATRLERSASWGLLFVCACNNTPPSHAAPTPELRADRTLPSPRSSGSPNPESTAPHVPPAPATLLACPTQRSVDVLSHDVDLSLELEPATLVGRGELRLRARETTSSVVLDAQNLHITSVAHERTALTFVQRGQELCVTLAAPLARDTELRLKLTWQVATDQEQPHFTPDQVWAGYQASAWLPTLQDPAQRATLRLNLTAPANLKVAASGQRVAQNTLAANKKRHTFSLEQPSPPFLYAFAAGDFSEAELETAGATLRAWGPASADLRGALQITARMQRFFVERLGAPLPTPEYLQIFVHGDAAQEAAGFALLAEAALDDVRQDPQEDWIFAHELAHQWFGWLVPCADFSDFWLNEGFASFLVAAFKEQRWGRAAYEREVKLWRQRSAKVGDAGKDLADATSRQARATALSLSDPDLPPEAPPSESELAPRGVTYARGALVLHKLRQELGPAAFWAGLQRYVRERAGKGARSEDLRRALEAASGRNLKAFFAKWVYRAATDL